MVKNDGSKMNLAYFSPLPPQRSGIAEFSAEILQYLSSDFSITAFTQADAAEAKRILNKKDIELSNLKRFSKKKYPDALMLYQIGSNKIHAGIYLTAVLHPGIVMLHEYVIHHLVKSITIGSGHPDAYTAEMGRYYGSEGREIARLVHTGRAASETIYFRYPLYHRIAQRSRAIITTTEYSSKIISRDYPDKPVYHVPISTRPVPSLPDREKIKAAKGHSGRFLIGVFGLISEAKEVGLMLDLMASEAFKKRKFTLALVGSVHEDLKIEEEIEKRDLNDTVIATGYLERERYVEWLAAVDLCINLRYPSGGESSAAIMETMGAGRAVVVPDYAQFKELPSDSAIKIPPGRDKKEILRKTLLYFYENPEQLGEYEKNAKKYIRNNHTPQRISRKLTETLLMINSENPQSEDKLTSDEKSMFEGLYKYFVIDKKIASTD